MYDFNQMGAYGQIYRPQSQFNARVEVIHVNGKNGAEAYQMPANSSVLLLDENQPLVYLAQTDGAGYKTITAYSITPYKPEPLPNLATLEERIAKLEAKLNESNNAKLTRKQPESKTDV